MTRPTYAHIDLDALRRNYLFARKRHGNRTLAVMKANAYGHGAAPCALALQDIADGYAVAFMDEAIALRDHGIKQPILMLEGVFGEQEMQEAFKCRFSLVVHHAEQVKLLNRQQQCLTNINSAHPIDVWLKIDTGMHRLGFQPSEVMGVYHELRSNTLIRGITLMTHFSRADEIESSFTHDQIDCFDQAVKFIDGPTSLCNSAGLTAWPKARRDWGRAGLMMYGVDPSNHIHADMHFTGPAPSVRSVPARSIERHAIAPFCADAISPIMTLNSRVMAVRTVPAGETIGYGAGHVTQRPTRIGVVAIGYGDGYPRHAPSGTPVLVDNQRTRLIGRVCMDMLMVELTDMPDSGIGSEVELWGKNLDVSVIAQHAGTISHALLTGVMRVNKMYSIQAATQ